MPPRPKVPFTLHPALRLRANLDLPNASRATLSPDGALAVVTRLGSGFGGALALHPRAGAPAERSLPAPERGWWDAVSWSRDGARWAAASERWDGDERRARVAVFERGCEAPLVELDVPRGGPVAINHQSQSAPLVALSPDGARVAFRAAVDERSAVTVVDVARGAAETHTVPAGDEYLFAHAWGGDGALYTVASYLGARGGTVRWRADGTPERRWDWANGCVTVPARDGVWTLGLGGVVWRVGAGPGAPFVAAKEPRLARARQLRERATQRWDVSFLDHLIGYIADDRRQFTWETNTPRARWGPLPDVMEGARGFDTEFLWECGFAEPVGDDAVLVSDGLSVALLRDRGATLDRATLLDDVERCSPRVRRIGGLTAGGGSVGVLWKKSATSTVLSLFDLDPSAV
ncbi:MAG: hypothetical protein U0324_27590 [Polyangiales bacterium]